MQVTINLFDPSAFAVNFSAYDREAVELVKDISRRGGGGPYDPATKTWFVPNTAHHVEQLKARFPEALWETRAKAAIKVPPKRYDVSEIDPAEFQPELVPDKEKLRDYQKVGVLFCAKNKRTLLTDCVGGGKTVQSLIAMKAMGASSVLVVVKGVLIPKWVRDIRRWLGHEAMSVDNKNVKDLGALSVPEFKALIERSKYLVTDYTTLAGNKAPILRQFKWGGVIADEAHRFKTNNSLRTKAFVKTKAACAVLVTATPILNKPIEIYPLVNFLTQGGFGSFDDFGRRYCGAGYKLIPQHALCKACGQIRKGINAPCQHCGVPMSGEMQFLKVKSYDSSSNLDELKERLKGIMLGRKKSEILADLPPFQRINRVIKMAPEFQRQYNACITDLRNYMLVHKRKSLESAERSCKAEALVKFGAAREILSAAKVEAMMDELREVVASGERAVVFTEYLSIVKAVQEALLPKDGETPIPVFTLTGEETDTGAREMAQKNFELTPGSVMVCTRKTGGEGIDMYWATHAFFPDLPWSPKLIEQDEGRLHRIGLEHGVFFIRYYVQDTYDDRVQEILQVKEATISGVIESEEVVGDILIRDMLRSMRDPEEPAA